MTRQIGEWSDPNWVLSIMHFPNDSPEHEQHRQRYRAIRRAQTLERAGRPPASWLSEAEFRTLINAAVDGESDRLRETAKRGIVAGDALMVLYALHESPWRIPEPSEGKAIHVISKFAGVEAYADGSPLPRSDRKIRECITEFRPVAHLWGAFRLHHEFPIRPHGELFTDPAGLKDFLGIARTVQDFGLTFVPKHGQQRAPILSEQFWRVPETVEIPPLYPPWPSKAPDWLRGTVEGYTVRNRE